MSKPNQEVWPVAAVEHHSDDYSCGICEEAEARLREVLEGVENAHHVLWAKSTKTNAEETAQAILAETLERNRVSVDDTPSETPAETP